MQAIILAGGLGTRLRTVAPDIPKPMAAVAGRPFLDHLLTYLESQDIDRVVLSVGHLRDQIISHYGDRFGKVQITYAIEESPLGTGGALVLALSQCSQSPVFVVNGDTWLELDYRAMYAAHIAAGALISVAAKQMDDAARYGRLRIDAGRITGFEARGGTGPGTINAGVYLIDRDALLTRMRERLPEKFSFEADFLEPDVSQLRPLAYITDMRFIDIGVPEDYHRAQTFFAS
ncbi:MAG: nucleotidyltransferase family protein [Alphaproteobacteria bacterium]